MESRRKTGAVSLPLSWRSQCHQLQRTWRCLKCRQDFSTACSIHMKVSLQHYSVKSRWRLSAISSVVLFLVKPLIIITILITITAAAESESVKSLGCVRLFATPMGCGSPGSSVHGILQAWILEWVAIPFSRPSSQPRDWTRVSSTAGRFFTL